MNMKACMTMAAAKGMANTGVVMSYLCSKWFV